MREHIETDQKEEIFVPMELSDSRKEELITILSKELVVLRAKSGVFSGRTVKRDWHLKANLPGD